MQTVIGEQQLTHRIQGQCGMCNSMLATVLSCCVTHHDLYTLCTCSGNQQSDWCYNRRKCNCVYRICSCLLWERRLEHWLLLVLRLALVLRLRPEPLLLFLLLVWTCWKECVCENTI